MDYFVGFLAGVISMAWVIVAILAAETPPSDDDD